MTDSQQSSERLRTHPSERFQAQTVRFDLDAEFERLPSESRGAHGHMQKTLYRRGGCTTAIFRFEKGAALREHRVDGEAIIHVLAGGVSVETPDEAFDVGAGSMLCLAPGVAHNVVAKAESRFVLHVALEG